MMASLNIDPERLKQSSDDNDIPLRNVKFIYEEDEYGYVDTKEKKISKALISQLPSRNYDIIDLGSDAEELAQLSLRRRQTHYRTLKLKNATLTSREVSADVDKIYTLLNLDPDISEEDKLKTLREMHQSLTIKRQVKEKLDADLRRKRANQVLDKFTRLKLRTHTIWHKFLYELKSMTYSLEPWHFAIKTVQGQFGSCVASYFIFLRWLLYLNLCNFFVTMFFLVIPQIAYEYSDKYKTNSTNEAFSPLDLMTGSGWLTKSSLYFGHYSNEIIELVAGLRYNMPLAYLFIIAANSIINLIAVSYSLTSSYQRNYIDTAGDVKHVFCNKVFAGWDFSIETEDAAKLRKIAFCNEIRELLSFIKRESKKKTLSEKILQGILMVLINAFCLGIVVAVCTGIYYVLEKRTLKVDVRILEDMALALTVTFVSSTFFFLLQYCTKLEYYLSKKTKLYLTMIRAAILRTAMIGIIVYFWMIAAYPSNPKNSCYETELGKEIYRLVLVNFFAAVIFFTFFGEFIRKLLSLYVFTTIKLAKFDVAFNTLDLIYYQTLAWIGSFCMPLAPLMIIVILILLFYLKLNSMASNCRPPKRAWSVNEAQTFFLTLLFLIYLLSAFAVGYVIFALPPSNCGPFVGYKYTSDLIRNIFFAEGEEHNANEIIKYLSSPGVLFAFFCALCVVVYYTRAQSMAHISVVKIIREQLIMEGKDKVFLLKLFDEAISMHSQINEKENNEKKDPPMKNSADESNEDVVFNENYQDYEYTESPHNSPLPRNLEPGYLPANVPINKLLSRGDVGAVYNPPTPETKLRSPTNSTRDCESPIRKLKGIHIPSHQPGFRHILLGEDSPRANSEEFKVYSERNDYKL